MEVILNRAFKAAALVLLSYIAVSVGVNHVATNDLRGEVNHLNIRVEDLSNQIDTLKTQMERLKETHPYMKK